MMQQSIPQPPSNMKDRSLAIRNNKIQELFQKIVDEEKLLLKNKRDAAPNMRNHPKYYPLHCLIRYALEDYREFKGWIYKSIKSGAMKPSKEYFEVSSTCYDLIVKERYDDGWKWQEIEEEPRMINNVQRLFKQERG